MIDLLALDQCRPTQNRRRTSGKAAVSSKSAFPLRLEAWSHCLSSHPDSEYVSYILRGLEQGFRIGFDYGRFGCRRARRNMLSARQNASVVDEYLREEESLGRVVPVKGSGRWVQISPFGVIPKSHQPGKWRLIVDLSSPHGVSVNDGIDKQLSSLSYARIDDAARRVLQTGTGTLLAKLDLQSAYRVIPVNGDDWHLLGVRWNGRVCLDTALPFGLRSAVADALLWAMYGCGRVFSAPSFRRFSLLRRSRDRGMCQQPGSRIGSVQKFGRSGSGAQDRRSGLLHDIPWH